MKKQKEIRNISFNASVDENSRTIAGMIPYNSYSENLGGWYEKLAPGCFSKTIQEQEDIRMICEHNDNLILARTKNGSLKLEDREDGLYFEFESPNTTLGNDTLIQVRDGLIAGMSFGMIVYNENYDYEDGKEVRTVLEARLLELSIVYSMPAYPSTLVYTRSLSSAFEGKEIDEAGQNAIKAEIEKLQSLLPEEKKEEQPEPEPAPEPEGPTEEEKQASAQAEAQRQAEEQKLIEELNARLEAAQKILDEE